MIIDLTPYITAAIAFVAGVVIGHYLVKKWRGTKDATEARKAWRQPRDGDM